MFIFIKLIKRKKIKTKRIYINFCESLHVSKKSFIVKIIKLLIFLDVSNKKINILIPQQCVTKK